MKYKDIIKINEEGLYYKDVNRTEKFIKFEDCRREFVRCMVEKNHLSSEIELELNQQSKIVAWRDATAKPMYIEFLSHPPIRFDFPRSILSVDPYQKFSKLQRAIINVGWRTFDLS